MKYFFKNSKPAGARANKIRSFIAYCVWSVFYIAPLCAYSPEAEKFARGFPDAVERRAEFISRCARDSADDVRSYIASAPAYKDGAGKIWTAWTEERGGDSAFVFSFAEDGIFTSKKAGTWIVTRDSESDALKSVQLILNANYESRLVFTPNGGQTRVDLIILGAHFAYAAAVSVPITSICSAPFVQIQKMTANIIPWKYAAPDPYSCESNRVLVSNIRKNLPNLSYAEDGAFNELGELVHISDGCPQKDGGGVNCSGFAKWVIDAAVLPVIGQGLFIDPLKTNTVYSEGGENYSSRYNQESDVFFGLNWTRNLAAAAASALYNRNLTPQNASVDVVSLPFGAVQKDDRIEIASGYLANAGFPVTHLTPALYSLAIDEPDKFYLASISSEKIGADGKQALRTHHHVAVLIPWFDFDGKFHVSVFESARETPASVFIGVYKDSFVHLTRTQAVRRLAFMPLSD